VAFLILFALHLAGLVAIIVVGNVQGVDCNTYNGFIGSCATATSGLSNNVVNLIEVCGVLAAATIVFMAIYIQCVRMFPAAMVWIGIGLNIAAFVAGAIYSGFSNQIAGAIVFGIMAAFLCLYFFLVRSRIAFAIEVLRVAAGIISEYPGTQVVAFSSIIVKLGWFFLWSYAVFIAQRFPGNWVYVAFIFLIFSFYWTFEVIKNVVHVTVSGVVASWYFLGAAGPASPTLGAFQRSVTTSLGSIACGSLIVALIKTLRAIIRLFTNNRNRLLACLCECFLGCIDRIVQYFNVYAFCQVAIYGRSYWEAAQATWHLMQTAGLAALVNDNILDGVLWMGVLLGSATVGALGYVLGLYWSLFNTLLTGPFAALGVGVAIGFVLSILAMQCLDSAITCTFVCFAEDKNVLQQRYPALYARLMESYFNLNA